MSFEEDRAKRVGTPVVPPYPTAFGAAGLYADSGYPLLNVPNEHLPANPVRFMADPDGDPIAPAEFGRLRPDPKTGTDPVQNSQLVMAAVRARARLAAAMTMQEPLKGKVTQP